MILKEKYKKKQLYDDAIRRMYRTLEHLLKHAVMWQSKDIWVAGKVYHTECIKRTDFMVAFYIENSGVFLEFEQLNLLRNVVKWVVSKNEWQKCIFYVPHTRWNYDNELQIISFDVHFIPSDSDEENTK